MDTFIAVVIIIGAGYFLFSRMKSKFSSDKGGCGCSGCGCGSGEKSCGEADKDERGA